MTRARLIGRIADHLCAADAGRPLRVAVDGITAAGKTTVARELAAAVGERGRPAIHLSMDHWHHPRAHRHRQGRDSATGYYEDAYDFAAFARLVLAPLGTGRAYRDRLHDLATDTPVDAPPVVAPADAVVVVDGSFLQRDLHWDEVVFVDTSFEAALDRGVRRDAAVFGGAEAATTAFARRYHAACRRYLSEVDPAARATVVLANDDVASPLLRRIGGPADATVPLFSYGTLQLPDVQLTHFGRAVTSVADTLPAHRTDWVTITDPTVVAVSGTDRHPIVHHTGNPTDTVSGAVLTLTTTELAAADTYEVDDYRRHHVRLSSGAEAWVYLA